MDIVQNSWRERRHNPKVLSYFCKNNVIMLGVFSVKILQIVSFKAPLILQVKLTSSTCKILGSHKRILYQQLISYHLSMFSKQLKLAKKILRIVLFKTPLDLEVKIIPSTCKISWIAELNPLSIANLLSLIHNLQTVKLTNNSPNCVV